MNPSKENFFWQFGFGRGFNLELIVYVIVIFDWFVWFKQILFDALYMCMDELLGGFNGFPFRLWLNELFFGGALWGVVASVLIYDKQFTPQFWALIKLLLRFYIFWIVR